MKDDGFLEAIAALVVLGAALVAGALGWSGVLTDPLALALVIGLLVVTFGLWHFVAAPRRELRREERRRLVAIEHLVGALRQR